ncbi:MAG: YfiM family protein [Chitinophagaceae bacterium]|nr:YfiM family protein [Chitinophagaceae bacterium]
MNYHFIFRAWLNLLAAWVCSLSFAQPSDSSKQSLAGPEQGPEVELSSTLHQPQPGSFSENPASFHFQDSISKMQKKRTWIMAGTHAGLYGGSLILLNEAWYKDYPKSNFQSFNDWPEWLQVDKVGHAWSAYQLSRASYAGWRWTGMPEKKAVLTAGLSGFAFLTVIEVLDGFSEEWGWSWGDFGANALGSGLFIGQQLAWKEQRISYKFGFHKMVYSDPQLNERSDDLFGSSLPERMLKDYNGQTYWFSANLKSFFKQSKIPPWLNVAVGYGATGMFGGTENIWEDPQTGETINRTDIPRLRQWYLAPDIDFTKIKTNSKWMRSLFYVLNAFKLPAPTLVLSNGKLVVHGFYF